MREDYLQGHTDFIVQGMDQMSNLQIVAIAVAVAVVLLLIVALAGHPRRAAERHAGSSPRRRRSASFID